MINLFGWMGNICFILGGYFLTRKWVAGWYIQILANLCHAIFAILVGLQAISLVALSVLLIIININGIKNWRNKQWILMEKN